MIAFTLAASLLLTRPAGAARVLTPILTYHDVVPVRKSSSLWFDCSVSELEEQIAYFREKRAHFVSIPQIDAARHGGKPLPPNSIAITFADNYLGFYRYALPIFKREGIPVTMFVHTGYVGNISGRPKMTWEQLRQGVRQGVLNVASQTVSHPEDLTKMSDAAIRKEFSVSRQSILKRFAKCDYLAYPNGKFDARVASLAKAAGYRLAFTERLLPQEKAPSDWQVPRYVHTRYKQAWKDAHPGRG